jgi:hypothetical protein
MCLLTCHPEHSLKAWRVMRIVLTSVNAYSALKMLQGILTNLTHSDNECTSHSVVVKIVRGAVFCVAMALWGSQVKLKKVPLRAKKFNVKKIFYLKGSVQWEKSCHFLIDIWKVDEKWSIFCFYGMF